jgi:hypothetical protein
MLAAGCGTSMQTSSESLNRLAATEGIVVGSVHIKGGKDILGGAYRFTKLSQYGFPRSRPT